MPRLLRVLAVLLALGGSAGAQEGVVDIAAAWARATPAGADAAAVYLTLQSPAGDRLIGAETPVAREAGVHEMTMEGSIMRMRPVPSLDLPPGRAVTLKPGGLHLMLTGLKQPLQPGHVFALTLHFAKAGDRQVTVAVERAGAMGPAAGARPPPAGR
jgi:periplasmic copper chaperone A